MELQTYIFFNGRCDEAIAFYQKAVGAEVKMLARFKDNPTPGMVTPGTEEKVMHAHLAIGKTSLLVSDGRCEGKTSFAGFAMTLVVKDISSAERYFAALVEGGQTTMPLTKTFYSPSFGMLTDKFGVMWMVYAE